jgi:hypothetical protein
MEHFTAATTVYGIISASLATSFLPNRFLAIIRPSLSMSILLGIALI